MTKTFILNVKNLNTAADAAKIEDYFMKLVGVEKVVVELDLSIVTLYYGEAVGSPNKLLNAFGKIGYPVR